MFGLESTTCFSPRSWESAHVKAAAISGMGHVISQQESALDNGHKSASSDISFSLQSCGLCIQNFLVVSTWRMNVLWVCTDFVVP